MTNPFEDFINSVGTAVSQAMNPEPTDASVYVKDGKLHLKLVYGNTSGGDLNYPLPDKDLTAIQKGILDYVWEKK